MATLDPRNNTVVIRIAYDGAPMSGKSTSVRALGRGLGSEVCTPAEIGGRTLYFDWLDYTGGLFEGHRIRCQIISVPGQATLAPRRRRLLESADAIVFVGDSTPSGLVADRAYLSGLRSVLEGLGEPPVGVVFQANKRDCPDAVPVEAVRSMLEALGLRIGLVESVATDGSGIREAFVFAVRLALDRVRDLMGTGEFATVQPAVDSAQDLLEELKGSEVNGMDYATSSGLVHTRLADLRLDSSPAAAPVQPATPDDTVASGMVWPPVEGRLVLHEIKQTRISLTRSEEGDWTGLANGKWSLYSAAGSVFSDVDRGRAVLVQSARAQATRGRAIPPACCLALAADGHGGLRLWLIERVAG